MGSEAMGPTGILLLLPLALAGVDQEQNQDYVIGDDEDYEYDDNLVLDTAKGVNKKKDNARHGSQDPRVVTVQVYINRALWETIEGAIDSDLTVEDFIVGQLRKLFLQLNRHLRRLDDGGFRVELTRSLQRLETSDVHQFMTGSYIDRLDGNVTKQFDERNLFSHTFIFQQAVERMEGRYAVDIRMLAIPMSGLESEVKAASEEHCVCDPDWFGCVVILSVRDPLDWRRSSTLLTHEFGHMLGSTLHDDDFYPEERADEMLMWSLVNDRANVWSGRAQKAISSHNTSCLDRGEAVGGQKEKQTKTLTNKKVKEKKKHKNLPKIKSRRMKVEVRGAVPKV